jgi:hypothetical protein
MPTSEGVRAAAALARAVDILRRSPEPGAPQKTALRALVALFAGRSATFRHYDQALTVDAEPITTADPRLATFAERLVAQHVAEIAIAQGAGPDELLALVLGLAAEPGQGRIKERLRDANSARVMVVYHQYNAHADRSVSAAFEKVKIDQAVIAEWNKYLEEGARTEADRMRGAAVPGASAIPDATPVIAIEAPPAAPTPAQRPSGPFKAPDATPRVQPPAPPPRPSQMLRQPPALQGSASLGNWFTAFERGFKSKFPEYFGDVDWGWRLDRAAATVTAGDRGGRGSVTVALPEGFVDQSAWILANQILVELRRRAENEVGIRRKR